MGMSEPKKQGSGNILLEFLELYGPPAGEDGPVRMAREVFGADLDPWQEKVLRAYGRGERGISIRACHGPGKTWVASVCIWHQLLTRFPQKTVVTAPSRAQLEDALFAEVKALYEHLPPSLRELFDVKKNRVELKAAPDESFLSGRTARAETPEALQGVHSDHVLLIADEASGVPEQVFEAAKGSMSGHRATTLLLSNPVRTSGFFFDTHHRMKHRWFTVHVGYKDSSRVSQAFADEVAEQYGERSNAYRVRALGEFPLSDEDTIIPWEYVESAQTREINVPAGMREVWGVDIARSGGDASALVRRNGLAVSPHILSWEGHDTMESAGKVKALWDETPTHLRPEWILVDVIGWGAGVVDRLRELGLPVRGINVAETASVSERYRNVRTELWFRCRDWLHARNVKMPQPCDPLSPTCSSCMKGGKVKDCLATRLATECVSCRIQEVASSGKQWAEPKAEMKKRGLASPNLADALMLTFAAQVAGMVHGTAGNAEWGTNWNEPVRLNRSMV